MTQFLEKLFGLLTVVIGVSGNIDQTSTSDSRDVQFTFVSGKVFPPDELRGHPWQAQTEVHLIGGTYKTFIREDGSFTFLNVPPGSYIVEVNHPSYLYEPVRVEINSKGKLRARKVNYINSGAVVLMPYPLKMKPFSSIRYFQMREQWRITDFLFNPMVLMMVLPLLLVMVLPRMMNDPEARKEMEQLNNLTKYNMPEMSEVITSYFASGSGGSQQKQKAIKQKKNCKTS